MISELWRTLRRTASDQVQGISIHIPAVHAARRARAGVRPARLSPSSIHKRYTLRQQVGVESPSTSGGADCGRAPLGSPIAGGGRGSPPAAECGLEPWELYGHGEDASVMWSPKFTDWTDANPPPLDRIGDMTVTKWRKLEREKAGV